MLRLFTQEDIAVIITDLRLFTAAAGVSPPGKLDQLVALQRENKPAEIVYHSKLLNITHETENAIIHHAENAAAKQVSIQLHLPPSQLMIHADRLFLQQVFFRLFDTLISTNRNSSVVSIYIGDIDGKCLIDVNDHDKPATTEPGDYFRKHRITNQPQNFAETSSVLPLYKRMIAAMGGELQYEFGEEKQHYFRMKFPIVVSK